MSETNVPETLGGAYFKSSVKKARQRLQERSDEIINKWLKALDMMIAAEAWDPVNDGFRFLVEHMPKEDGVGIIDESAAKPKMVERGPGGPVIQIGVKVGGVSTQALPEAVVIDVNPER